MNADDAKELVTAYIERVWNRADQAAFNDLTAPTYRYHLGGQLPRDSAATQEFLQAVHRAFPNWRVEIQAMIVEGDHVAVRWQGRATHSGVFQGLPPTGRQIEVCGINLYRIEQGRIAEEWEQMDSLGLLQQLGLLPPS